MEHASHFTPTIPLGAENAYRSAISALQQAELLQQEAEPTFTRASEQIRKMQLSAVRQQILGAIADWLTTGGTNEAGS